MAMENPARRREPASRAPCFPLAQRDTTPQGPRVRVGERRLRFTKEGKVQGSARVACKHPSVRREGPGLTAHGLLDGESVTRRRFSPDAGVALPLPDASLPASWRQRPSPASLPSGERDRVPRGVVLGRARWCQGSE